MKYFERRLWLKRPYFIRDMLRAEIVIAHRGGNRAEVKRLSKELRELEAMIKKYNWPKPDEIK